MLDKPKFLLLTNFSEEFALIPRKVLTCARYTTHFVVHNSSAIVLAMVVDVTSIKTWGLFFLLGG